MSVFSQSPSERDKEIRGIWHDYSAFYQFAGGVSLVLFGILIGALIFGTDPGYPTNLYTETISIGVTVFVLNLFNERRDHARRMRELRERLMREMGSSDNATARNAVRELQAYGWLFDGSIGAISLESANLREARLQKANLAQADFMGANLDSAIMTEAILDNARLDKACLHRAELGRASLRDAQLNSADLREARFGYAALQNASLRMADMREAALIDTNVQNADLRRADLSNAILIRADLRGANLLGANLCGADLRECHVENAKMAHRFFGNTRMDAETILPDGTRYTPEKGVEQLERFTHPAQS
jgi:uncharacterized protein YjbI with pentapeptide repeats